MKKVIIFCVFILTTLACAAGGGVPTLVASPVPLVQPTDTPAPSPAPVDTPTVVATTPVDEDALPSPVCITGQQPEPLASTNFEEYGARILDYLNAGATSDALYFALDALNIDNQPIPVVVADFTGNGFFDVAVSIYDIGSATIPPRGRLLIYLCDGAGTFELAANIDSGLDAGGPKLWFWDDLNNDGAAEIVYSLTRCGASTCFEQVQVLQWRNNQMVQALAGISDDLPNPNIQLIDYDGDGIFGVEVAGSGAGSVGAGPPRAVSRVWEYKASAGRWELDREILLPSSFRIHAVHDADITAFVGDLDVALLLYEQVYTNPNLIDWVYAATEQLFLSAYARYKIVVIQTIRGDELAAQQALAEMSTLFTPAMQQWDFVDMAVGFRNAYFAGGVEAACIFARDFAASRPENILEPLGSAAFGYNNRDYTGEDMCPVSLGD